jgi:phosphonopyruvate decarboxylase
MIEVKALINILSKNKSNFYTGVPDSILSELSNFLIKKNSKNHIIATNEGSAISIAIGHNLSTKNIPCVYMQNSGLSNAINPLISIAHRKVYSIPLILIIGWRGSPKQKDEPQHNAKGKITEQILKLLGINYTILKSNKDLKKFDNQIKIAKKNKSIVACLIEKNILKKNKKKSKKKNFYNLDKEIFIKKLLKLLPRNSRVISSTGYNSRELMFLKDKIKNKNKNIKYFYMVGGMGHTSSVALGYSLFSKHKIICIDGDGSMLMHLGSISTLGFFAKKNLKYILLNNNIHDSVGGQSTNADKIIFKKLSQSVGFKKYFLIKDEKNLDYKIKEFINDRELSFLEVKISNSKIKNLPRPKNLQLIKDQFLK